MGTTTDHSAVATTPPSSPTGPKKSAPALKWGGRLLMLAASVAGFFLLMYVITFVIFVAAWSNHPGDDYWDESAAETPLTTSEAITGVVYLTPEKPSIDIPVKLTNGGAPAATLRLTTAVTDIIPFGERWVDSTDFTISETMSEPGEGIVTITLDEPEPGEAETGPAQVRWTIVAEDFGDRSAGSGAILELEADPPPDTLGPSALLVDVDRTNPSPMPSRRFQVDVQPESSARLVFYRGIDEFTRVATEDGLMAFAPATQLQDIALPQRCLSSPDMVCSFELIVTLRPNDSARYQLAIVEAEGTVNVIDLGEPEWQVVRDMGTTEAIPITPERPDPVLPIVIDYQPPPDPIQQALTFVKAETDRLPIVRTPDDEVPIRRTLSWYWRWADACCEPAELFLEPSYQSSDMEPFTVTADWTVEVWSPVEPASDLTVEVMGPR